MSDVEVVAAYCKCSWCTVLVVGPTGTSWRRRRRGRKEESLLRADAVNEEDPERDRGRRHGRQRG